MRLWAGLAAGRLWWALRVFAAMLYGGLCVSLAVGLFAGDHAVTVAYWIGFGVAWAWLAVLVGGQVRAYVAWRVWRDTESCRLGVDRAGDSDPDGHDVTGDGV